jgi:poly(3-hydroxybutyrate) depolymerase
VWKPGDANTISLTFGNEGARSYDVYVGKGVKVGTAVPLLVSVHGLTNTPAVQAQFSQMNPVADAQGFVVVYPAGLNASFNAGSCCGQSSSSGVDDVGFIRAVVADAETKICIDRKRVYQTGFSNGGMMAYELACHAADLFAAVAPTEGDNQTIPPCNPARPVPLAAFQYQADPVVLAVDAQQSAQGWAQQDGCTDASPTTTAVAGFSCEEWSKCAAGASVWYCTAPGGTHYPPLGSAPVIWNFLSQFTLP